MTGRPPERVTPDCEEDDMASQASTKEELLRELGKLRERVSELEHNRVALRRIKWLLERTTVPKADRKKRRNEYTPPYGNLTDLNTSGVIRRYVGEELLNDIVGDYLDLLDTSGAIYELSGDYALGIFSSGWCRLMDCASRDLCRLDGNREALDSGRWLCHESCWTDASKASIEAGEPVDIECQGGIRLHAVPVWAGDKVVGSMNFGYGDPPRDPEKLKEIASRFNLDVDQVSELAHSYESRPPFIVDIAKQRLQTSAKLVGEIIVRKQAEEELLHYSERLEHMVEQRTHELSEAQERLLRQERLAVLGQLAGGVGHELRNPLGAIKNAAYLLKMAVHSSEPDVCETLDVLDEEVDHCEHIIASLLDFARPRTSDFAPAPIPEILDAALERVSLPNNVALEKRLGAGLPAVCGDAGQLKQVFRNIIANAVQAMPEGGTLTIAADQDAHGRVAVSVTDTGVGIPVENREKLFEPLFTTKARGIGLGLAVIKTLVERHDGRIDVESEAGKGSTFTVSLPVRGRERA
jgi:signal transduction histidine kinase